MNKGTRIGEGGVWVQKDVATSYKIDCIRPRRKVAKIMIYVNGAYMGYMWMNKADIETNIKNDHAHPELERALRELTALDEVK